MSLKNGALKKGSVGGGGKGLELDGVRLGLCELWGVRFNEDEAGLVISETSEDSWRSWFCGGPGEGLKRLEMPEIMIPG